MTRIKNSFTNVRRTATLTEKGLNLHDKRYSIFISSTFEDLKQERQAVQDVVISAGDFPVQMESFPAADEDQFSFIKTLIDKCDYYVLIVGGRYGTLADDGMSYTEKEYRYAVSVGVPVLVMLHGNRGSIPFNKSEDSPEGKKRLAAFVQEVANGRLRKTWTTPDDLKLAVREALDHSKATKPRVGWVRGDTIASVEALEELNEVRKQNQKYRDTIGHLEVELAMPQLPATDSEVDIELLPVAVRSYGTTISGSYAKLRSNWIGAFPIFFSNLQWSATDWGGETRFYVDMDKSFGAIGAGFAGELASFDTQNLFRISKSTYDRLSSYYVEVGLMETEGESPFTDLAKKFARRQTVSGNPASFFTLIKGDVISKSDTQQKSDLDDEIPF